MNVNITSIPQYQSHKKVRALKIVGISLDGELGFENHEPILMEREWLDKHNPAVGGYLVFYEDGYKSFSPALAFEKGYTLIGE